MDGTADSNRMGSVDFLKGFIIIAIVGVHLLFTTTNGGDARAMPLFFQIFYLGLMSFYIISGYYYRPGKGFVVNMKKRAYQLVITLAICSVVFPLILYIWLSIFGQTPDPYDIWYAIKTALGLDQVFEIDTGTDYYATCGASVGYYYLWTMVWGFLIFYALADHVLNDKKKFALTMIVLLAITMILAEFYPVKLPFFLNFGPLVAMFMFAGAYMARCNTFEYIESFQWKSGKYWLIFVACAAIGIGLSYVFNPGTGFDWFKFGDYGGLSVPIYFIEALLMFLTFTYLCKIVSMVPVVSWLFRTTGQHTLGILLLHGFIATLLIAPFFTLTHESWFPMEMDATNRVALFVATLIVCVVICRYGPKIVATIRDKIKGKKMEAVA